FIQQCKDYWNRLRLLTGLVVEPQEGENCSTTNWCIGIVPIRFYGCTRQRIPRGLGCQSFLGFIPLAAYDTICDAQRRLGLVVRTGSIQRWLRKRRAHAVALNR